MTEIGTAVLVGKYSAGTTLGSLVIVYGMNEFLSTTGYSWYRFAAYQGSGIVITFIGWVVLLTTVVSLYEELEDQ